MKMLGSNRIVDLLPSYDIPSVRDVRVPELVDVIVRHR
jgi:hypothetical protein